MHKAGILGTAGLLIAFAAVLIWDGAPAKAQIFNSNKGDRAGAPLFLDGTDSGSTGAGAGSKIQPLDLGKNRPGSSDSSGRIDDETGGASIFDLQQAEDSKSEGLGDRLREMAFANYAQMPEFIPASASGSNAAASQTESAGKKKMVYDSEKQQKKGEERQKKRLFNFR